MPKEKSMIKFINIARQNPSHFISCIETQIAAFTNEKEIPLDDSIIYQTIEGKNAWIEALQFLKKQKPIEPLQENEGLNLSARDHAKDICKNNIFGHLGSDGSSFTERIFRYCKKGSGSMAELIGADFNFENRNHAQMTVLGLIVDDGVPDRGHRNTIFSPSYKQIGSNSQTQRQKLITVFHMSESKLDLKRSQRKISSLSSAATIFQSKLMNQIGMPNIPNSPKSINRLEDQFSKTEWISKKQIEKEKQNKTTTKSNFTSLSQNFKQKNPKANGFPALQNRKLREKKETTNIFYQEDSKITQVTIKLVYNDGTMEEKIERHTIYDNE